MKSVLYNAWPLSVSVGRMLCCVVVSDPLVTDINGTVMQVVTMISAFTNPPL